MLTYEPLGHIKRAAEEMVEMARENDDEVQAEFNKIRLVAKPDTSPESIVEYYNEECDRRSKEYQASPECKRREEEAKAREGAPRSEMASAMEAAPGEPTWSNPEIWQSWVDANKDGYGGAVITYAHRWARAMEGAINDGQALDDCADHLSNVCDEEGVTGFMYGCAVQMLSQAWVHGEELRRWHNSKTQIHDEGDKANEAGGVLNPAVLNLGS